MPWVGIGSNSTVGPALETRCALEAEASDDLARPHPARDIGCLLKAEA